MEEDRRARDGAKSAVSNGWLLARPAGAMTLKMPQAPAGLGSRNKTFGYFSGIMYQLGKAHQRFPRSYSGIRQH